MRDRIGETGGVTMFVLVKNATVYAPEPLGRRDILLAGERIAWMGQEFPENSTLPELDVLDASDLLAVPGFVDGHVHLCGGGGEGGFATRTPEIVLSSLARGGVTSVVGVLGTDSVTRTTANLVAKALGLVEEGVSAWCLVGSYQLPVKTLTGSVEGDLVLVDRIIGVGEIALSDHRSSQPSMEEVAKVAAAARVGGILSGKAGVVNVHLGDGPRGLDFLRRICAETEIPLSQFLPTHMNRNPRLFEEGIRYAQGGGFVDITTSTTRKFLEEGEVSCAGALRQLLEAGVPPERISFSSDGQGSLPDFDATGTLKGLTVGSVGSLFEAVREAVLTEGVPLAEALPVVTSTPATVYKLPGKGYLRRGFDADLVLLDRETLRISSVLARGRILVRNGTLLAKGTFEA